MFVGKRVMLRKMTEQDILKYTKEIRWKLILLFCFIFLTACSNEINSISGEIDSIGEDSIFIDCSDLVAKSDKGHIQEDIGYSCAIKITDNTMIKTQAGDELKFDELNKNNLVTVYLEEPTTLSSDLEWPTINAKEITVFEKK